jgi:chromosome segregation ATPase
MTELLNALGEFFRSPLGVIILTVLTAVGASTVSRIRARTERAVQIDKAVGESEAKTKTLMLDREAQSLKLIDAIRDDWVQSQRDIAEMRAKYDAVVDRNIQLISEQRMSLEAINRLTNELEDCNTGTARLQADAAKLHADFQTMLDKLALVQAERDTAQVALGKRNGEFEALEVAYKKRNAEFEKLNADFMGQKKEIERLQSDLWETRRDLAETKERLTTLENKPGTGELDPNMLPPIDPAEKTDDPTIPGEKKES